MVVGVRGCGCCTVVVILANIILLFFSYTGDNRRHSAICAIYLTPVYKYAYYTICIIIICQKKGNIFSLSKYIDYYHDCT